MSCVASVTNALVVALFGLPFVVSMMIPLLLRRSPAAARTLTLVTSVATALCATALLPRAATDPTLVIRWLPGTGPMTFSLSATSLYAALVTTWAASLTLLATTSSGRDTPPSLFALVLLALSAGNVAFLSKHFLSRYVALEIVALSIALAPLVELKGDIAGRGFWFVFVMLRLGGVGLLSTIKILYAASGTLEITPALEAAAALDGAHLGWVVLGLLLAVWVKLGSWPLHVWISWGRGLSPGTQAWLYAALMPNLGAYLLYRVTPLLALNPTVQSLLLWLGAGAALLAVITALTRRDVRSALIHIASARGGLLVFAAAAGLKPAVWLALLATTPLQLLLLLTGDAPERGDASVPGRAVQCLFAIAGLTLSGVGLLITWWARQAGAPRGALFVAEASVALLGIWAVREAAHPQGSAEEATGSRPARWMVMVALGLAALAGAVTFLPVARWLMDTAGVAPLRVPSLATFLGYSISAPAILLTLILGLVTWQMKRRSHIRVLVPGPPESEQVETTYDLQEGLVQAARAVHAIVEVGFLEQILVLSVRTVLEGARVTYRLVEQEGLEGLLSRLVRGILALSQMMRRRHTGLLRHNLLWIPISLTLVLLVTMIGG